VAMEVFKSVIKSVVYF